ncbi:MAG: sugar ABC transporter permease, partial [Firmicutes bacterium]|nr:sugar ABC transporter permease [Bacillota bacterium]
MNNTTADLRKTASFAEGAKGLIKKNTMSLALVVVVILIEILLHATGLGTMFKDMNISNLVSQNAYVLILATGMLLCILTGGNIDLSVGSMVCFIGAVGGQLIVNMNANIYVSILCCLAIGLAVGAWQGFWIAYVRIPAFIVTLAGMLIWRGMGWIVLNGYTISPMPKNFLDIFNGFLPGNSPPATALRTALIGAGVLFLVLLILIVVQYVVRLCRRARERKKGHEVKKFSFPIRTLVIGIAIIIVIAAMLY